MSASSHRLQAPVILWFKLAPEKVLARLGSSEAGLSTREAKRRLAADGPNELKAGTRVTTIQLLLGQFKSLLIWILLVAGVISGVLGDAADAFAIFAIVILNAVIGFYQEFNAENSIAALQRMTAPQAKVRRDDKMILIPASGVVTGDILCLEAGDMVAADARLIQAASLKCTESALTGEPEAVTKRTATMDEDALSLGDRRNMVFMGTSVAAGTGCAVVVATGMQTELGRIASLIRGAEKEHATPLQRKLDSFGRILVWAALGIVALLFVLGLWRGTNLFELFMTSISLAVAAVPEGLPAVVTVALSLGVSRMARRGALVRKLAAVETLGSTNVICTDKTGTLTVGEMTVREIDVSGRHYAVTGEGYAPVGTIYFEGKEVVGPHRAPLLELAMVQIGCNNAHLAQEEGTWKLIGDPTEGALLAAAAKAGAPHGPMDSTSPKYHEIPFDSERKRGTIIRKLAGGTLRAFINGAPDVLLARSAQLYSAEGVCSMMPEDRERIAAQNAAMAKRGLRVLASAYRDLAPASPVDLTPEAVEHDLVFVGLSGMQDPPRSEARDSVAQCRSAGIQVVMITGDHPDTASAIAQAIGIASPGDLPITGAELETMSDDELRVDAPTTSVYARVTAAHKLRIIRALKANDSVVAMTGDGVNDAPAIKGADIGVAMGRSGTEVTKQASDMIITDDNFSTIVAAVEEGRGIYDNIRKTLQYLLAGNAGELMLMTVCVVMGLPSPLLPIHLLWVNLVTDGLPALCLATDPIDPAVMRRRPRLPSEHIVDRNFLWGMLFTGGLTAGVAFTVYLYHLKSGSLATARSYAFAVLVFAELMRSFGVRSDTKPVWRVSLLSNLHLVAVVVISVGIQVWSQHSEILGRFLKTSFVPFADCFMLFVLGLIPFAALEIMKWVQRMRRQNSAR